MARSVEKWVGATDDTAAPPRVRLRIFERFGGVCQLTGRKIQVGDQWELDHKVALINGGANDEDNLVPVLRDAHRVKTAEDVRLKAKADRVRKKHLGIKTSKAVIPGSKSSQWKRKVDGTIVRRGE